MTQHERYKRFRLLVGGLALFLMGMTLLGVYRSVAQITDGSTVRYITPVLEVTASVPAVLQNAQMSGSAGEAVAPSSALLPGDRVVSIEGKSVDTVAEVARVLDARPRDASLVFLVVRGPARMVLTYQVSNSMLPAAFLRERPTGLEVQEVWPDGASERAGLQNGDLILSVNGRPARDWDDALRQMQEAEPGVSIPYEVLRNDQRLTIPVTPVRIGWHDYVQGLLALALLYMGVGAFLALSRPHLTAARLCGLAFLLMGYCLAPDATGTNLPTTASSVLPFVTFVGCLPFALGAWVASTYHFPVSQAGLVEKPWIRWTPFLLASAAVLAMLVGTALFGYRAGVTVSYFVPVAMFGYYFVVRQISCRARTAEYRRMNRPQLLAFSFFLLCNLLPLTGLELSGPGLPASLVPIPLAYLYTVRRHDLLEGLLRRA